MDNTNNFNQQPQQSPYNQQYQQYQPTGQDQPEKPITLGEWIIIMILVAIPCVNIIMLFIWAFGKNVNTSKKNYSRAMLIFMLIGLVLGLIFGSVFAAAISSLSNMYY